MHTLFYALRSLASIRGACAAGTPAVCITLTRRYAAPLERLTDPFSDAYKANKAHMDALASELGDEVRRAAAGGGETAVARHRARGKLLPRERIDAIVDEGSQFLELSPLAGKGLYGAQ